ncbi:MAG: methyltransferase domain-containing protein [Candidatus Pacebacteria bacterium]|jgi:tRNA G10  N-methylase Trm11|nr:methyltransferase domain-containing protein [Candidatus Paceibacterota bacterium]
MSKFLFLFGNTPQLSLLELDTVYPELKSKVFVGGELDGRLALVEMDKEELKEKDFLNRLGGLVKIFQVEKILDFDSSLTELKNAVLECLISKSQQPHFSFYQKGKGQKAINHGQIKDLLKEKGYRSRYFKGSLDGSAFALHQESSQEIFLYHSLEGIFLSSLIAVQDIDDWTKRDRAKPYFNRKKGMLPPKVARMLVNIASGMWLAEDGQRSIKEAKVFDPFCGTGTILIEALQLGSQVYGADLDEQAVWGTRENLEWFANAYQVESQNFAKQIFMADVGQLSQEKLGDQKIDLLITEPFLGRQTPKEAELANIFKGLEKLYLGAFNNFSKILNPGAKIGIIFPKVVAEHQVFSLDHLIDKLNTKGYNLLVPPLLYARSGARVQREVYFFTFN